jgi:septal ring factor EnvC (AmiA/AmiB activator)
LPLLGLLALLAIVGIAIALTRVPQEVTVTSSQVALLNKTISTLDTRIKALNSTLYELKNATEVKTLKEEIQRLKEEIQRLEKEIQLLKQELEELKGKKIPTKGEVETFLNTVWRPGMSWDELSPLLRKQFPALTMQYWWRNGARYLATCPQEGWQVVINGKLEQASKYFASLPERVETVP